MSRARDVAARVIPDNAVTSAKIVDGAIVNADINAAAAITAGKLSGVVASSLVDAAGDLIVGSADNAVGRLPLGNNGEVLTVDTAGSGVAKVKWAAATGGTGYRYVQSVYFTSSGTFTKATYPWLAAIRVRLVGGGGGGGGASGSSNVARGGGGGGGAYAEAFITNIAGLAANVTVTVGAAGTGGNTAPTSGNAGGTTSFGASVSANGGGGAFSTSNASQGAAGIGGATPTTGDFRLPGSDGAEAATTSNAAGVPGVGGASYLASGIASGGSAGKLYGGGGGGGASGYSGGAGAAGIVIVDLFA